MGIYVALAWSGYFQHCLFKLDIIALMLLDFYETIVFI